jgi:hypothetical protein
MAEHYVHLSHSDLEDVLHYVWVARRRQPGELLSARAEPQPPEQLRDQEEDEPQAHDR